MGRRGVPELPWVSLVRCLVESAFREVCLQSGENTCLQRDQTSRGVQVLFHALPSEGRFPFLIHVVFLFSRYSLIVWVSRR